MLYEENQGYIPVYKRTYITDELHNFLGARTDYEIASTKSIKNILKSLNK